MPYNQNAYHIADLGKLKSSSASRVNADPTFRKISENAVRLRKKKDQSQYPLQAEKYRQWNKRQDEESKQFEDIFQPIGAFTLQNLSADLPQIQGDTSRIARNDNWLKEKKKDIQLYEAFHVMQDMIRLDALAGKQ